MPLQTAARSDMGLLVLSACVGLLGGLGAVVFRALIGAFQAVSFGNTEGVMGALANGGQLPAWRLILAPAIGGLLVGPMVTRWAREAKGHGVPQLMRMVQLGRGVVPTRVGAVKTLASAICIGSGGSCGREGPIAQIGAALGSVIGLFAKLPPRRLKVLVAAGAAAGIAATFNAPIAGAFFALEIVLGNFAVACFGPIVVASVAATVLSRAVLGDHPAFQLHGHLHELRHPRELAAYVVLGFLAAGMSLSFTHLLVWSEELCDRMPIPEWVRPVFGGLGVGLMAWFGLPEVLGNGSETSEWLLGLGAGSSTSSHHSILLWLLLLILGKLLATCLTLGSGGSGGVFSPSLYMGASLGALVGHMAGLVLPGPVAAPGAYALVGMAAVAAGTTHAPITMMLIVFELTNDYRLIAPLMIAAGISALVARSVQPESIYTFKMARSGIRLNPSLEHLVMHHLRVLDVMRRGEEAEVVLPQTPIAEVLDRFLHKRVEQLYVVAEDGTYKGVIFLQDVKGEMHDSSMFTQGLVIAEDVIRNDVHTIPADAPLTQALKALHLSHLHEIPVVGGEGDDTSFVGTLSEHDLLGAYNQEVLRQDVLLARFVTRQKDSVGDEATQTDYYELPAGFGLAQVAVSPSLQGKTLAGLAVRAGYGLNVLAIKVRDADGNWKKLMPDPSRVLEDGDLLIVMGPLDGIERLSKGVPEPSDVAQG